LLADRAPVGKRAPVEFLLVHHGLELLRVVAVDVNAEQGEGLFSQVLDERPLVGPAGPSGESEIVPEVEQYDLAAVIAQPEAFAVLVFPSMSGACLPTARSRMENSTFLARVPTVPPAGYFTSPYFSAARSRSAPASRRTLAGSSVCNCL